MTVKPLTITISADNNTQGAFSQIDGALDRTRGKVVNLSDAVGVAGARANRQFGVGLQQAGYQVGDFATQVASGQSALVAFTQQGTQVLGAFGPWGAVIGAATAVVGAFAVGLMNAGGEAETTEESIESLSDAIGNLRDAAITNAESLEQIVDNYGVLNRKTIELTKSTLALNKALATKEYRQALNAVEGASSEALLVDAPQFPGQLQQQSRDRRFAGRFGVSIEEGQRLQESLRSIAEAQGEDQRLEAIQRAQRTVAELGGLSADANEQLFGISETLTSAASAGAQYEAAVRKAAEATEYLDKPVGELRNDLASLDPDTRKAAKALDAYRESVRGVVQEQFGLRNEIKLFGAEQAVKDRFAAQQAGNEVTRQLTEAAKNAPGGLTPERAQQIESLAETTERLTATKLRQTRVFERFNEVLEEEQERFETARDAIYDTTEAITRGIMEADSFADALRNVGLALAELAVQGLGGNGPFSFLGDLAGNLLSSALGPQASFGNIDLGGGVDLGGLTYSAKGNAFQNGRLMAFANGGVVDKPTLFPMANGAGLMGEAGPEGILPLKRGADGKLGVSGGGGVNYAPTIIIQGDATERTVQLIDEKLRASEKRVLQAVPGIAAETAMRGGKLGRAIRGRG